MRRFLERNDKKIQNKPNPSSGAISKTEKQQNQSTHLIKLTPIKREDPNRVTNAQKVIDFFLDEQSNYLSIDWFEWNRLC